MKKVECPDCRGYGTREDAFGIEHTCKLCNGSGLVDQPDYSDDEEAP